MKQNVTVSANPIPWAPSLPRGECYPKADTSHSPMGGCAVVQHVFHIARITLWELQNFA